jgi:hypothetical protein
LSTARRLTAGEYENVITDVFGLTPSEQYPGTYGESVTGYSTEPGISVIGEQGVERLLFAAEEVAEAIAPRVGELLPCASQADAACAESFLETYGRRLFRRSLTSEESAALIALYETERADGATFEEGVAVMTAQLLQMPAFLYSVEAVAPTGTDRRLSGLEVASRLAFHLWNSAPDERLLDLSTSGELDTPEGVRAEAQRLFDDPRSDRAFVRFFREWTQTTLLSSGEKDASVFDYLSDDFVASVNESFDRFVTAQMRSASNLHDLLRSNTAFVDANLATFFGVPAVTGWSEVELAADRYTGIMTQPGMLAALAHSAEPSYVFRGRFVRKRLLCNNIGIPPGNAMAAFSTLEKPPDPTGRELSAVVRSQPVCGGCHSLIDPPGLAFEHFNAMGGYREAYDSGKAIDTSGVLDAVTATPIEFTGPADLMQQLAELPLVRECFARQVFRYTAARLDVPADACAVQQISDALEDSDGQLAGAFIEATQTDAFLYRRGE